MEYVKIVHPDPEVADSLVPQSAVDVWRQGGWLTEEEFAAQQAVQDAGPAAPPQGDAAPAQPPARSTTKEK